MTDFTNKTSQTLDQLRSAEDHLTRMLWNAGNIVEQLSGEQIVNQQVHASVKEFSDAAQHVQHLFHQSISNLERISSGLSHEDSCYAAWLDFNLASIRNENIRNKLFELKNHPLLQQSRDRVRSLEEQLALL